MAVEKYGHIVGIAENVGHALTFKVLSEDTQRILHQSIIRTATNPSTENKHARNDPYAPPHPHVQSCFDIDSGVDNNDVIVMQPSMPIIHLEELIG